MSQESDLGQLYETARLSHLQPLWVDTGSYVPRQPSPKAVAAHWPAQRTRELLRELGKRISSEQADRRVLVCNNPGLPSFSGATQTIYACLQLLMGGERASEHRHSQNAFRFVLSGEGAASILNGRRIEMRPGDFVATPAWTWHGHVNESGNEVIWLDGLDNAIPKLFDATFFELPPPEGIEPTADVEPVRVYDWASAWRAIERLVQDGEMDPAHGFRLRYLDPQTGQDPLPTMAAHLSFLPKGFQGQRYRSSDSTVFLAYKGRGRTELPDRVIEWGEHDVFTVPTWQPYRHILNEDAVVFSYSDRAAQERLQCWREQRNDLG